MHYYLTFLLLALCAMQVKGQTEEAIPQLNATDPCTVCRGINEAVNTNPAPAQIWFQGESNVTCSQLIPKVDGYVQGDEDCQEIQLMAFQLGCCRLPPYDTCDICPDGSDYVRSNTVPVGSSQQADPTCAVNLYRVASYNALVTPGTCEDTLLQRGAFYCGCPNTTQQCYLCPDQQAPTNPERGDAWLTGSNCDGLAYLFSLYNESECGTTRENWGVDFANFCRCPDYVMNSTGHCAMCEGGIENPDFVYTGESDPFTRTCQQAQDFAESIFRENICIEQMNAVISKGCVCKGGTGPVFHTDEEGTSAATSATIPLAAAAAASIFTVLMQWVLA